jgi:hypothetical protein
MDANALHAQNGRTRRIVVEPRVSDIDFVPRSKLALERGSNPGTRDVERKEATHEKHVDGGECDDAEADQFDRSDSSGAISKQEPFDAMEQVARSTAWSYMMPRTEVMHAMMRVMTMRWMGPVRTVVVR